MTTAMTLDLDTAVTLAQRGDEHAFAALVTRYKNLVFSVALSVLRDADAANDVTQNVFLTAWQRLRELRSPSSLPPWLRETARRQALHHLRSRVRERTRAEFAHPDAAPDTEAQITMREEARALEVALDEVPDDAREALLLYYSEEQSIGQVAALLELSEDAVKKRLQRARVALREEYEQALGRKMKRVLPGAALVAAILGGLERTSHAARRPRWVAGAALSGVASVVVILAAIHASRVAPSIRAVMPSTVPASVASASPASATAKNAATPTPGATPHSGTAGSTHRPQPRVAERCDPPSVDVADHVARAEEVGETAWTNHDGQPAALAVWRTHVAWLAMRCPAAAFFDTGMLHPLLHRKADEAITRAWDDALRTYPDDPRVLGNYAAFVAEGNPDRARELLERAAALEPNNHHWASRLGDIHAKLAHRAPTENRVDESQNSVGYFDVAIEHEHDATKRRMLLFRAMNSSFNAKEYGAASQRATELIDATTGMTDAFQRSMFVYAARRTIASIAFQTGHEDEAARLLLTSVEGELAARASIAPDLDVAQALLGRGHVKEVLLYFEAIAAATSEPGCLPQWIAAMKAGEQPRFEKPWSCP